MESISYVPRAVTLALKVERMSKPRTIAAPLKRLTYTQCPVCPQHLSGTEYDWFTHISRSHPQGVTRIGTIVWLNSSEAFYDGVHYKPK